MATVHGVKTTELGQVRPLTFLSFPTAEEGNVAVRPSASEARVWSVCQRRGPRSRPPSL